jgi:hypothetical protein
MPQNTCGATWCSLHHLLGSIYTHFRMQLCEFQTYNPLSKYEIPKIYNHLVLNIVSSFI